MRGSMRIGGLISDSFPFQQLSVSSRRGDRQVEYLGDRGSHRPVISFLIAGYDIIGYDTSLLIRWTRQWDQGWFACHEVAYFHGISQRINIPVDELREHLAELPKDTPIVVTCAVGLRGYLAYRILTQNGFTNVRNLSGGYKTWSVATAKIKNEPACAPCSSEAVSDKASGKSSSCKSATAATTIKVDACGLMCPGPIMQLKKNYENLREDESLEITATDQAFGKDVSSWCKITGAELVSLENKGGTIAATVRKKKAECKIATGGNSADNKTLIVFSDDLDKALASFVIANGAASTGKKVTMFFTFWGLNVIKKREKPAVSKDIFGKMFGWMLPANSEKLKLSKMNMGGAGSWMMRLIMKKKRIDSLESLMAQAVENGIEMIACTMSMDVMGVKKEELMDNVVLGGVATYLERAEDANVNLFI